MNRKKKRKVPLNEKLKGWKKIDNFWGGELWAKGKKRCFYSPGDGRIVYTFTVK